MRISDWSSDVCSSDLYISDRRNALDIHGKLSSGVVVVKSSGNDAEMIALKAAMAANRPVAAVGPSDAVNPTVDDLRRSDERRVGKECVSTCSSWWSPYTTKKK